MISFILNEETIHTTHPAGMTVLDFIRYHKDLKGTKIGCREGDCGACTILVGEIRNAVLSYRTMTSCLLSLSSARGKHIVTIEGINSVDGTLTPVQSAIVVENGTQCGFCTPGFVMSLTNACIEKSNFTIESAIESIDGNICRCTGYKSLERAAARLVPMMEMKDGVDNISFAIEKKIIPGWFSEIKDRLKELSISQQTTTINTSKPILGGGTDLFVQQPEELENMDFENVSDNHALRFIRATGNVIEIGGSSTVSDLMESPVMQECFPHLHTHLQLVSSTPIRNMATVAGNLVNASPIGDLTIWFLGLDATVTLKNGKSREVPLRDFYQGYKIMDLNPGEIVEKISFRKPDQNTFFNFEKVSKRQFLDIATVNTAISLRVINNVIEEAHVSAGGVSPIPLYLKNLSSCLLHKQIPFDDHHWQEFNFLLQSEISPISDVRGSEDYKRMLLQQLFHAHFKVLFQAS